MKSIKIMSFNLWCGGVTPERTARVIAAIKDADPDILGVQEATPLWMNLLREALPAYIDIGIGREGGDKGEYSAIFVKRDRFDVLEEGTKWLTATPDVFSAVTGSLCPRVFTYAKLHDKANNRDLCHINTHLDHGPEDVRVLQAHYLDDFMKTLDLPLTVTGDFNCAEGTSPTYKFFTSGKVADAKLLAKTQHAAPTFHNYTDLEIYIDFCFLSKEAYTVADYSVIDTLYDGAHPSDHNPVTVIITPNV